MANAASIVTYTVPEANGEALTAAVRDHLVPAARETHGYEGFLLIDQGEGKRMAVLLYESPADVRAAQQALSPVGEQFTYSLMSSPAIGSLGTILLSDGLGAS